LLRAILRLLFALGGAALAALLVALLEARVVAAAALEAGEQALPTGTLLASELGILFPVALGVGGGVGVLVLILMVQRGRGPLGVLGSLRDGAALDRLRAASAVPIGIFAAFAWCVATAHLARVSMGDGKPAEAGLTVGAFAVGSLVVLGAIALACLPLVRRLLALGSASVPQLLDPALTGSIAVVVVGILCAIGIVLGDTSGGDGGALGIFGVLKRSELDLRPIANVGLIAVGAFLATVAMTAQNTVNRGASDPRPFVAAAAAVLLQLVLLVLCVRTAGDLGESPTVARGIEKNAPLGKKALALLRAVTDRDKDGFSASFAGGDCNDKDPRINPGAIDIPGNDIDEDCNGADTPAIERPTIVATTADAGSLKPKKSFNVIFITVDTLRPDLGFMGWDKPTSPNLDKVAEKATVFERAYSMASYTGKAVGPMLIGKYPSETVTNFDHFNTYYDANVFLTERLHDTGVRTFGGMCHWYFKPSSGLKQGFDVWDYSAIPPGMGDNDTVVTSDRMADLALKLLKKPENTLGGSGDDADGGGGGPSIDPQALGNLPGDAGAAVVSGGGKKHRFFAWFHFFDPHAQYVAHEGSPDMSQKGQFGATRNLYDQEIWYTDKHIGRVLDYVASQPWADETAIVMTADHGEAFYEHGMLFHGSEIWEELVRVPLLVYVPGAEPRRVPQRRSHIDIAPTILELMGVPLPDDDSLRGHSLLADVYRPKDSEHEERDVYIDMPAGPYNGVKRAIITGPTPGMKLIHSGAYNYQLFDLSVDPDEKKDLSNDKEKLQAAIKAMNNVRGRLKEIEVKPNPNR
jgi:choline-sulfatase